jgi:hypothetical protein
MQQVKIKGNYNKALKISSWLKEQGAVFQTDYVWYMQCDHDPLLYHIIFRFEDEGGYASLLILRWGNDD